jgi:L-aminopeptidase/D-esterase-like protein
VAGPLPDGFAVGHWSDPDGGTGCTVVLAPDGATASGEVRGGGPGTRESDLLSPAAGAREVQAVLFTGGSAFGLAAADGVVRWLEERGRGYRTRLGTLVPLVPAAVVFDLPLGDPGARPGPAAGAAACDAAGPDPALGTAGAGTGCAVGKLLGPEGWTKGGIGLAAEDVAGCRLSALAVVNAFGDVLAEDGEVLAGVRGEALAAPGAPPAAAALAGDAARGRFVRTTDLLRAGGVPDVGAREATTLVCVMTDARLDRVDAWLLARSASTGIARAVDPAHTAVDGDASFVLAAGVRDADPLVLAAIVPHVVAAAIRDGVRAATSLHGCPAIA